MLQLLVGNSPPRFACAAPPPRQRISIASARYRPQAAAAPARPDAASAASAAPPTTATIGCNQPPAVRIGPRAHLSPRRATPPQSLWRDLDLRCVGMELHDSLMARLARRSGGRLTSVNITDCNRITLGCFQRVRRLPPTPALPLPLRISKTRTRETTRLCEPKRSVGQSIAAHWGGSTNTFRLSSQRIVVAAPPRERSDAPRGVVQLRLPHLPRPMGVGGATRKHCSARSQPLAFASSSFFFRSPHERCGS